ncbi:HNH endonuclease [Flavobacterium sp. HJSW_4]|uniref:HNH endonuclease n=1 Tax=Flavobacterium sp. HJSW_4 TaxID=3344660 RepID=UPI0035F2DAC2
MKKREDIYLKLVELYGEQCYICGRNDVPLFIEHLIPQSVGGLSNLSNLRLICAADNTAKSNKHFRETELVNFLLELTIGSRTFRNSKAEILMPDSQLRGDISTERKKGKYWEELLIEVKTMPTFTEQRLKDIIIQLKLYQSKKPNAKIVFAFPGVLPEQDNEAIQKENIEIWDIPYISKTFANEISNSNHSILKAIFSSKNYLAFHDELVNDLNKIRKGKIDWLKYQKHVGKILEYLFGDVLSSPITELSDHFKINRRDFILRNYAELGFWSQIRNRYYADFIVVDAKNYSKKVTKKEILQISNYLKVHGSGLFGLILSRNGGDRSAYYTCREVWAMEKKMILVLDDVDIEKMIMSKYSSNNPEEILRQKIEEFRLSM